MFKANDSHAMKVASALAALALVGALAGCTTSTAATSASATSASAGNVAAVVSTSSPSASSTTGASSAPSSSSASSASSTNTASFSNVPAAQVNASASGLLDGSELFTNRDLAQTADTSSAQSITLASNQDVTITEEGIYVVSGTASNASIVVDADSSAKVGIVNRFKDDMKAIGVNVNVQELGWWPWLPDNGGIPI